MNKTKRTSLIFISIIIVITIWLVLDAKQLDFKENKETLPDAFMTNIHATQIDKSGQLQSILIAPKATHIPENNRMHFITPNLRVERKNQPAWHITSDEADTIDGMDKIILRGNVHIFQPAGKGSHDVTFITSEITYYPDRSFATTDKPITIKRPASIVHAIGLNADLNKGEVQLMSQTDAQYGTKPKKPLKTFKTASE